MSFWNENEAKKLFQEVPFYNVLIQKRNIKHLLLHELPFFDKLSVVEVSQAFKGYTRTYKTEIIDSEDALAQLEVSKSRIGVLFKDLLLNEMKALNIK